MFISNIIIDILIFWLLQVVEHYFDKKILDQKKYLEFDSQMSYNFKINYKHLKNI